MLDGELVATGADGMPDFAALQSAVLRRATAGLLFYAFDLIAQGGEDLRAYLADRVAKWWLPDAFAFIDEVPKTGTGKYDKKRLRARLADGQLETSGAVSDDHGASAPPSPRPR